MGKIAAHRQVTLRVIEALRLVRPDEDYPFLELGNFLTDIEQLRDPTAMIGARAVVDAQARGFLGNIPVVSGPTLFALAGWVPDLLGTAAPRRQDGALTRFAVHLARFVVHESFSAEASRPQFKLDPKDLDEVLDNHFRAAPAGPGRSGPRPREGQYYPHAHLDLPPFLEGPRHRDHPLYQRGKRGLINYLEEQIQYLSEDLSKIEQDFLRLRDEPAAKRRPLLVRLGRALHGIEDYYFHSNFAELLRYNQLKQRNRREDSEADRSFLLLEAAGRLLSERNRHLLRRRFARRLLYPSLLSRFRLGVATAAFVGSPTESIDARDMVYTGGFGAEDINHSVVSALPEVVPAEPADLLREVLKTLELADVAFNRSRRQLLATSPDRANDSLKRHQTQLLRGNYHKVIRAAAALQVISPAGARELLAAFDEDLALEKKYRFPPGVGGFLILFLSAAERKVMESDAQAAALERVRRRGDQEVTPDEQVTARGTDNGVGAEIVGTHSLMAKDDPAAAPFHEDAIALASYVSTSVASLLMDRVRSDPDPNRGLDWDSILRAFLRYPDHRAGSWELRALDGDPPHPAVDAPFRMLGPDFHPDKLKARREGTKGSELEQRYQDLEVRKSEEQRRG